jgi:hypothetical protein
MSRFVQDLDALKTAQQKENKERHQLAAALKDEFASQKQREGQFTKQMSEVTAGLVQLAEAMKGLKADKTSPPRKVPKFDTEEDDDLILPNLRERLGNKGKKVTFNTGPAPGGAYTAEEPTTPPMPEGSQAYFSTLTDSLKQQASALELLIQRAGAGSSSSNLDPLLASSDQVLNASLKSQYDLEAYERMIWERPEYIVETYHRSIRAEQRAQPGQVCNPVTFGDTILAEDFKKHTAFGRFWAMMADLEVTQASGDYKVAHAKTCQYLKCLGLSVRNGGRWEPSWEHTFLPRPYETRAGVTTAEAAMVGRAVRDRAAIEKALKGGNS